MNRVKDEPVVIARRFNGPPRSGHGGCSAGVLVDALAAEVTLQRPPPLAVARDDGAPALKRPVAARAPHVMQAWLEHSERRRRHTAVALSTASAGCDDRGTTRGGP